MAISDTLADFLTGIRNGYRAGKESVTVPASKMKIHIAELLKKEGYIKDFSPVGEGTQKFLHIKLRYLKGEKPAILNLQRVSKPGLRVYSEATKIPRVRRGLGVMVVSTSKGVMTDAEARKQNVGGELICKVW